MKLVTFSGALCFLDWAWSKNSRGLIFLAFLFNFNSVSSISYPRLTLSGFGYDIVPAKRITTEEALEHPYLAIWHDPSDEPACPTKFDFRFEVVKEIPELRTIIFDEVRRFRGEVRAPVQQQPPFASEGCLKQPSRRPAAARMRPLPLLLSGASQCDQKQLCWRARQSWDPIFQFVSVVIARLRALEDSLLSNRLRNTRNASLCERIVDLSRITMQSAGTRDVDNVPWLAILDSKVRRSSAYNLERRCRVQVHDCVPLLICHFVDHAIPCVACIVNDDVDLAVAKVGSFLNEGLDIGIIKYVAGNSDGLSTVRFD